MLSPHVRRFYFAQRPVVPLIRFRLLSGAEISGAEISVVFIAKQILLINYILLTIKILFMLMSSFMMLGLKLAAPVLITLFNVNLALTMLARVAPQMNIFMLSFQVKIAVGLVILFVSVPLVAIVTKQALGLIETEITNFLMTLNPALAA